MANSLHDPRHKRLVRLLARARKAAGLTQRDLAEKLGQPHSYIGKLESGQRRLDLIELIDVLEAIDVKPSEFIAEALAELRAR